MTREYPTHGRRLFSLSLIAVMLIAVSLGTGYLIYNLVRAKPFTATARFLIAPDQPSFLDQIDTDYERRNEIFRQTQLSQIRSEEVILSALREPGIAALPVIAPYDNKAEWLTDRLEAQLTAAAVDDNRDGLMDADSRILLVQLQGTEDQAGDLRRLINAVSAAYLRNVVYKEQQRQATSRFAEQETLVKIRKHLVLRVEERDAMKAVSPDSAELHVLEIEIDELTMLFRHLVTKLELQDLTSSIGRVRQIESEIDLQNDQRAKHSPQDWWRR